MPIGDARRLALEGSTAWFDPDEEGGVGHFDVAGHVAWFLAEDGRLAMFSAQPTHGWAAPIRLRTFRRPR